MSLARYFCWDLKGRHKLRRLVMSMVAECLGVAVIIIVGCSAAAPHFKFPLVYIIAAFGIGVSVAIMAVGHISGGYVNPAVTVAALILGKVSPIMAILYMVSQCIGGVIGMQTVLMMQPDNLTEFCVTKLSPGVDPWRGVFIEAVFTSILALLVCSALDHRNANKQDWVPIGFGIAVIGLSFAGVHLTGCSMNPARSLAPALLFGNFQNLWVYWVGPISGGLITSLFYRLVLYQKPPSSLYQEDALENEPLTSRKNIILQTRRSSNDGYVKATE